MSFKRSLIKLLFFYETNIPLRLIDDVSSSIHLSGIFLLIEVFLKHSRGSGNALDDVLIQYIRT